MEFLKRLKGTLCLAGCILFASPAAAYASDSVIDIKRRPAVPFNTEIPPSIINIKPVDEKTEEQLKKAFNHVDSAECKDSKLWTKRRTYHVERLHKGIISKQQIWDFTRIAFSRYLWGENTLKPWRSVDILLNKNEYRDQNSDWEKATLTDYTGPIKSRVINKWNKNNLTIAVGWPFQYGFYTVQSTPESEKNIKKLQEVTRSVLNDISTSIKDSSGISIKLISKEDVSNPKKEFPDIRIFPRYQNHQLNLFKFQLFNPVFFSDHLDRGRFHSKFGGSTEFTPDETSQVDGYIVPDKNHNIISAVCNIWPGHSETMLENLVSECLLRSLGLLNSSELKVDGLLSAWNNELSFVSKTISRDRNCAAAWGHEYELKNIPVPYQSIGKFQVSDYDNKMLSLLYCPEIKPGMEIEEAVRTLNNKCTKER